MQVIEALVHNKEQASLGIRKAKLVEVVGRLLAIIEGDSSSRAKTAAPIAQMLVRTLAAVMSKPEARAQFGRDLASHLSSLIGLMKKQWFGVPRQERSELVANGLKAMRLLAAGEGYVQQVENEFH